jgi:hypothetical protein
LINQILITLPGYDFTYFGSPIRFRMPNGRNVPGNGPNWHEGGPSPSYYSLVGIRQSGKLVYSRRGRLNELEFVNLAREMV